MTPFKCLFVIICCALFCACANSENLEKSREKYTVFTEAWNSHVKKISPDSRFMFEPDADNAQVLAKLRKWCLAFTMRPDPELERQLAALSHEAPNTFEEYARYRTEHHRPDAIALAPEMTAREVASAINAYAGIKINGRVPDYVNGALVGEIINMNSLCAFFRAHRQSLRKKGIDAGISDCGQLGTNGRYPWLDALVDR